MSASEADVLARRVADTMLSKEGTGPSWGLVIEEARKGYSRVRMLLRSDMANGHGGSCIDQLPVTGQSRRNPYCRGRGARS